LFANKVLLITGGTGSFGNAVVRHLLSSRLREIRIFSRDEKKQDELRKKYNHPKIKFYLGDVRDYQSVLNAMRGVNFVFHAAALKQVPSCEFYPLEAVKTNVLGTENVLEAALLCGVARVVVLSTDKAVYPINAMGASKAMMEKVAIAKSRNSGDMVINVTRYGNVMCSRGSVIPLFVRQINQNVPITITDPTMTRFMMTLDSAVDLVLFAFEHGKQGEIFIQKAPAATIDTLARALIEIFGDASQEIQKIGTRHGEKLYESLLSREEMAIAKDLGGYYCVPPDERDLNYNKFLDNGQIGINEVSEYNSHNTVRLDVSGMIALLKKLRFVQAHLNGEQMDPEE
jgi:UDP-N-acetylglucosamine 4,6-dehydratase/5-epimerase